MGSPLSAEHRARISAGQIARHRRDREARIAEPDFKRCSRCKQTKPIADFSVLKRKLKSGEIAIRPRPECRACTAARSVRWRERRGRKQLAEDRRRWSANRDREKARAYGREWAAAKRRENGAKQYGPRVEPKGEGPRNASLAVDPLASYLQGRVDEAGIFAVALEAGEHERRIRSILNREFPHVTLAVADRILCNLGHPEQLQILYPDTSVGYHVLAPPPTREEIR